MATNFTPYMKKVVDKYGYKHLERVEYWNGFTNRRIDFLNVGDYIMLGVDMVLVQVTSASNASAHKSKAEENDLLPLWLNAGGRFWLVYFKKRKNRWNHKILEYKDQDWSEVTDGFELP